MKTLFNIIILGIFLFLLGACANKNETPMYEGQDMSKQAFITRDKTSKEAFLDIRISGEWQLFAGETVEEIDFSKPILEGNQVGTYPLTVKTDRRWYFSLKTEVGKAILSEKHLPMTGGYNFRDIGGYKTTDNRHVRWGKLFRTDDLSNLTKEDLNYLASIPIRTVVDFRDKSEIEGAPDVFPTDSTRYIELNMLPGNFYEGFDLSGALTNADSFMIKMYESLVTDPEIVGKYKDFFALLQDETNNIPLIYHCSAGKDRTGIATALILSALDVPEETILEDYLLSNIYLEDKYASYIKQMPAAASFFTVKKEFLEAGLNKIKEEYGSIENYLQDVLKVDILLMKEKFLI
jgi:Protein tyrosine/serine phosphatase